MYLKLILWLGILVFCFFVAKNNVRTKYVDFIMTQNRAGLVVLFCKLYVYVFTYSIVLRAILVQVSLTSKWLSFFPLVPSLPEKFVGWFGVGCPALSALAKLFLLNLYNTIHPLQCDTLLVVGQIFPTFPLLLFLLTIAVNDTWYTVSTYCVVVSNNKNKVMDNSSL